MAVAAIHYMNPGNTLGWQKTACGIECRPCGDVSDEYDTLVGNRIEAKYRNWKGVTCRRCLRNCASPGGKLERIAAARR